MKIVFQGASFPLFKHKKYIWCESASPHDTEEQNLHEASYSLIFSVTSALLLDK